MHRAFLALYEGQTASNPRQRIALDTEQLSAYIAQWVVGTALAQRGVEFTIVYQRGDREFIIDTTCNGAVRDSLREVNLHIGPHGFKLLLDEIN